MTVTAHCANCGEVGLDEIDRSSNTRFDGDKVIETITVTCSRCGGSQSSEYSQYKTSWMAMHGYKSVTEQPMKSSKRRNRR